MRIPFEVLLVGLPSCMMNLMGVCSNIAMNRLMASYCNEARIVDKGSDDWPGTGEQHGHPKQSGKQAADFGAMLIAVCLFIPFWKGLCRIVNTE